MCENVMKITQLFMKEDNINVKILNNFQTIGVFVLEISKNAEILWAWIICRKFDYSNP